MATKVVLVTGANRGIGRRLVERLLSELPQYRVILTCRSAQAGSNALREISSLGDFSSRLLFHPLDVLSATSISALKDFVVSSVGQLDVLVNNAGIAFSGPEFNEEVVSATLGTNFFGTVNVTEALLSVMKPGGHIVMVSSRAGLLSNIPSEELRQRLNSPTLTCAETMVLANEFLESVRSNTVQERGWPLNSYRVSKNLLNAYIRSKSRELQGRLRLNGLCPGWVRTDMGGPNATLSLDQGTDTPLAVVRDESEATGAFWAERKVISW